MSKFLAVYGCFFGGESVSPPALAPMSAPNIPVTTGEHIMPHVDPRLRKRNAVETPKAQPIAL